MEKEVKKEDNKHIAFMVGVVLGVILGIIYCEYYIRQYQVIIKDYNRMVQETLEQNKKCNGLIIDMMDKQIDTIINSNH